VELARGLRQESRPQPLPPTPASSQSLSPEARARFRRAEALLNSDRVLTPEELGVICDDMISTLESNPKTS
jgi:hypothetical protein